MTFPSRHACLLFLLLGTGGALHALPPGVDPALFPDAAARPPAEIELAGLSVLYPGRVLRDAPFTPDVGNEGRAPQVWELGRGDQPHWVTLVRVYDLGAVGPKLGEWLTRTNVILDLRYVSGNATDAETFAGILAKAGLASVPMQAAGTLTAPAELPHGTVAEAHPLTAPPVLVLTNGKTAGPLEAWLAAFQAKESLLAVGTPTAGQPGVYKTAEAASPYYVLAGELQPGARSIAGTGLQPRFPVDVMPEQNFRAYMDVEHGTEPATLLRHDTLTTQAQIAAPASATGTGAAPVLPKDDSGDPVLQRAVDIVAALQLLGRMPASPPAPAGTATVPAPSPSARSAVSPKP